MSGSTWNGDLRHPNSKIGDPVGELGDPIGELVHPVMDYFVPELRKIIIEDGIRSLLDLQTIKIFVPLFLHTCLPFQRSRKD